MKILLIKTEGETPLDITDQQIKQLKSVNESIKVALTSPKDKAKIEEELKDCDVIAGTSPVISSILNEKNIENIKWIHAFSAGVEKVLTPKIINSKIIVSNSSGIHAVPIAEHVLGTMLIFTRRFYDSFKMQQKKIWKKDTRVSEIRDKTVAVIGLGNIGKEIARLSYCFGANVVAVKQNTKEKVDYVSKIYSDKNLDQALAKADFVVVSLPLTPSTKHLFNLGRFKKMKKSGAIINIGRGPIINEKDLIIALEEKIIAGAGLDVTEVEPLPKESKLWGMENVIITPHHSGWSEKYMVRAIDQFCINLKAYFQGKKLPNLVDKTRGY